MIKGPPLLTFSIAEPYPVALRMVRKALVQQGLRTPVELDISTRIRQELGAGVAPCVALYVDDPALLLEAAVFHRGAGVLIPQPVVVAGDSRHAEVLLRNPESLMAETPESIRDPLLELHRRITRALEAVSERQPAHLAATP